MFFRKFYKKTTYVPVLSLLIITLLAVFNQQIIALPNKAINQLIKKTDFRVKRVYLSGNKHLNSKDIAKAINVKIGASILSLDLIKIKNQIERLSWVKLAVVTRKFPNILSIAIVEREAIALWQNDKKLYLIDEEGIPIAEDNLKPFKDLIILIGEDAPIHAYYFINMLQKNDDLYRHISYATRIGERRWNVTFYNDLEIKLPENNMENSWNYVIKLYKNKNLFAFGVKVIDLRVENKIYIR
jgi:cell division protein FtsQ